MFARSANFIKLKKQNPTCLLLSAFNKSKSTYNFSSSLFYSQQTCPYQKAQTNEEKVNVATLNIQTPPVNEANDNNSSSTTPKTFDDVPGPEGLPVIAFYTRYGPIAKLTLLNKRFLLLGDPSLIAHVARNEERRNLMHACRYYRQQRGIVMSPIEMEFTENWMPKRQLFNVAMCPDFVEKVAFPQLTELNSELIQNALKSIDPNKNYELQNGMKLLSRYAFNSVLKTFLGVRLGENEKDLPFDVDTYIDQVINFLNLAIRLDNSLPIYKYIPTKTSKEALANFDAVRECTKATVELFGGDKPAGSKPRLKELIEERAKGMDREQEHIADVLSSFLIAGVDATSRVMSYNLYRLAHHKEYQEKLYKEFEEIFGPPTLEEITSENGLEVTLEQFKKLKLVKHFVEETLRMNGIAFISSMRVLNNDLEIGGYMVPKETAILFVDKYCSWSNDYVKRADEFIPEI
ncbi:hypothetical protein ABK040_006515 [Willaertia magna]